MHRYFFLLLMILTGSRIFAQNHFVYLQSETNQPFTVTVNDKKFTSTNTGYVIVPKLKSGTYNFLVRFTGDAIDTKFSATIDNKDFGFTVRSTKDAGISLVDIQSFNTLRGISSDVMVKNEKSEAKVPPNPKADDAMVKVGSPNNGNVNAKTVAVKMKKGINKISEVKVNTTYSLRFIDIQTNGTDTIDVIIPISKVESESSYYQPQLNPFIKWASNTLIDEMQDGYNTKCVYLVTKDDYAKLRKAMATETDADKMIAEAVKVAKSKCLETDQVKRLTSLFSKQSGKYKFLEAMYPYVYNYLDYSDLESLLTDNEFKDKFKLLLNK